MSQSILEPLETFAVAQESNMIWPVASPTNQGDTVWAGAENLMMFKIYHWLGTAEMWTKKAPNVNQWPGDVKKASATKGMFTFESTVNNDFFLIGMYLQPGKTVQLEILTDEADDTWTKFELVIGSHTDELYELWNLKRWPAITHTVQLYRGTTSYSARWMFGALVYFKCSGELGNTLRVKVSGAIPTPYFDLENPDSITPEAWDVSRSSKGLVADIRGTKSRFTIPAYIVKDYSAEYLTEIMQKWDSVVEKAYNMYAYPEDKRRRQWITTNIQITKGSLHSGYPICGHIKDPSDPEDINLLDGDWENRWGAFHEIGHNLASDKWMYKGSQEVVNNLCQFDKH